MKTQNLSSHTMKTAIALAVLATSLFFLASCRKEEVQSSTALQTVASTEKNNNAVHMTFIFKEIKIDHIALQTRMPDYMVTLNANGNGIFEGRKNVSVLRTINFTISASQLLELENICLASSLESAKETNEGILYFPHVTTTYTRSDNPPLVLADFDYGYPVSWVSFRKKVEAVININKFI